MATQPQTLFAELLAAQLPVESCDSDGNGTYLRPLTAPEQASAAQVIAAHQSAVCVLSRAISAKAAQIDAAVNAFIFGHFNLGASLGITKRHTKLTRKEGKGNLSQTEQRHITEAEAVDEWSRQVMVYAYGLIDVVILATTLADVEAVTWDFEGLFGTNGTQLPKPAVSVREFLTTA